MRVVQAVAGLPLGGAEKLVMNLCSWLQAEGHTVEVVNFYPLFTLQSEFESVKIPVRNLHLLPYVSRWYPFALVRYLRRIRPDVVHCHNAAWRKIALACHLARVPCVWTLHNYHDHWMREQKGWMLKAIRYTQAFVGVEPQVSNLILQELPVEAGQVHYIANGVPDIFYEGHYSVEWRAPIPEEAKIVGMISRLAENKDPYTLVDAMVEVHRRYPKAHLVFAGTGPLEGQVRQHIAQVGAEGYVHLLGLRQDVPAILHAIDVFVLSSHLEGQPLAIIEAMSAQRPIVATDVGGNSILLDGGRCGILVPPRAPRALAESILELLTNREKARLIALQARQRFLEHFTIGAMGKMYLEVYQEAISRFQKI